MYFVAADAVLTLADILGDRRTSDERPWVGQWVQLSRTDICEYRTKIAVEACEKLELTDIYTEKFLLCHAFVGGTNTHADMAESKVLRIIK